MTSDVITTSNITFVVGLLAILFSVYHYFRNPQVKSEKEDALLAQRVNWQEESINTRFRDIQESFNGLLLQSNNHIHTVEVKVDGISTRVGELSNAIIKLETIIEERVPKRNP